MKKNEKIESCLNRMVELSMKIIQTNCYDREPSEVIELEMLSQRVARELGCDVYNVGEIVAERIRNNGASLKPAEWQ